MPGFVEKNCLSIRKGYKLKKNSIISGFLGKLIHIKDRFFKLDAFRYSENIKKKIYGVGNL